MTWFDYLYVCGKFRNGSAASQACQTFGGRFKRVLFLRDLCQKRFDLNSASLNTENTMTDALGAYVTAHIQHLEKYLQESFTLADIFVGKQKSTFGQQTLVAGLMSN